MYAQGVQTLQARGVNVAPSSTWTLQTRSAPPRPTAAQDVVRSRSRHSPPRQQGSHHHWCRKVRPPCPHFRLDQLTHARFSSGLGLEAALVFAQEGAHVVCADINPEAAARTVDLISKLEGGAPKAIAVVADVGKENAIKELVAKALEEFGRLDIMLCVPPFSFLGWDEG